MKSFTKTILTACIALGCTTFSFAQDGDGDRPDRPRKGGKRNPAEMFKRLDKDGNGELTAAEAPRLWERAAAADTDGSGGISMAEMKTFREARRKERGENGEGRRGKRGPKGGDGKGPKGDKPCKDGEGAEN